MRHNSLHHRIVYADTKIRQKYRGLSGLMADARSSKILTLVFTDLADSTALKSEHGDEVVDDLLTRHREHVSQLAEECAGRIIDWAGDGCFLTFDTSSAAVMFSLRLQQAHTEESDLPGVRIGIHLGEVTDKPGPDGAAQVKGLAVDVAARVSGLAKPGQILMSSTVYSSAKQRLGVDSIGHPILWQAHGTYSLKGFDQPLDIGEAGLEGAAPLEAPKASEKARLIKKAAKVPTNFSAKTSAPPLWLMAVAALLMLAIGAALNNFLSGNATAPPRTSSDVSIQSIAVLPLDNFSGEADQQYFTDGMTEALTAELAKIRALKVISRTSMAQYRNTEKSAPEIALELGVDALIEGSVYRSGDEVRITAQLIHGASDEHMWADDYTGTLENVFALQGEVALAIARQIKVTVLPEEEARIASARSVNPEAYEEYLQGRARWWQRSEPDLLAAIEHFERAKNLDPEFAPAYAGIADAYMMLAAWEFQPSNEMLQKAKVELSHALELEPDMPEALRSRAHVSMLLDWDRESAERGFRRALELEPNDTTTNFWYGYLLAESGRFNESKAFFDKAIELDPLMMIVRVGRAFIHGHVGDFDYMIRAYESVLAEQPDFHPAMIQLFMCYLHLGNLEEAERLNERLGVLTGAGKLHAIRNARLLAASGDDEAANEALSAAEAMPGDDYVSPFSYAYYYVLLGDDEKALYWLDRAVDERDFSVSVIHLDYRWSPLWDNPRFWNIAERIGFSTPSSNYPSAEAIQRHRTRKAAEELLAAQPPTRFTIVPPVDAPLAGRESSGHEVAISPDGQTVVYVALEKGRSRLYRRNLNSLVTEAIPGTDHASSPQFSEDGSAILFELIQSGEMMRVPTGGGTVSSVLTTDAASGGNTRMSSERVLLYDTRRGEGLVLFNPGDAPRTVTEMEEGEVAHLRPRILPGRKTALFQVFPLGGAGGASIESVDLETGARKRHVTPGSHPVYSSSGYILYANFGRLMAVRFSAAMLKTVGDPFLVVNDVVSRIGGAADFDLSGDGTLVYVPASSLSRGFQLMWVDMEGNLEPLPISPAVFRRPALSSDGERLLISVGTGGAFDIWLYDITRGSGRRITTASDSQVTPVWSRDEEAIYYYNQGEGYQRASLNDLTNPTTLQISLRESDWPGLDDISPVDGTMVFTSIDRSNSDLHTFNEGSGVMADVATTPFEESLAKFSRDGRWIAYQSNESGTVQIYLKSYPDSGVVIPVSIDGGISPMWSPQGDALYFVNGQQMLQVNVEDKESMRLGNPKILFELPFQTSGKLHYYDIHPDGDRFLMMFANAESHRGGEIVVVKNFVSELKRLDPNKEPN